MAPLTPAELEQAPRAPEGTDEEAEPDFASESGADAAGEDRDETDEPGEPGATDEEPAERAERQETKRTRDKALNRLWGEVRTIRQAMDELRRGSAVSTESAHEVVKEPSLDEVVDRLSGEVLKDVADLPEEERAAAYTKAMLRRIEARFRERDRVESIERAESHLLRSYPNLTKRDLKYVRANIIELRDHYRNPEELVKKAIDTWFEDLAEKGAKVVEREQRKGLARRRAQTVLGVGGSPPPPRTPKEAPSDMVSQVNRVRDEMRGRTDRMRGGRQPT